MQKKHEDFKDKLYASEFREQYQQIKLLEFSAGVGIERALMNEQLKYSTIVISCFPIAALYPLWREPELALSPVPGSPYENAEINRPTVLYRDGCYHMWYSGQMRPYQEGGVSVICYCKSDDGLHWSRSRPHPALSANQPWEQTAIMCPHVMYDEADQLYKMWYSGGSNHESDAIGYACSHDGFS